MAVKTLRPYQSDLIEGIRNSIRDGHKRIIAQAVTGAGKCLGIGTPVMLSDGRVISVEDVAVGDTLMGPDSRPRTVLSTCRGQGQLFRIVPVKGNSWVCNDVHVLTLVDCRNGNVLDISLDAYLRRTNQFKHVNKLFFPPNGVKFNGFTADPEIPAYFAGIWIGDGSKLLNGVAVSKPDPEIYAECLHIAHIYGLNIRTDGTSCPTHHLHGEKGKTNALLQIMRRYFSDKRIDSSFRTASRDYRLNFLAGIIDTDGYVDKNCIEIVQKNEHYTDVIEFVAQSVGLRVTRKIKTVNDDPYHRLLISGHVEIIPTRIPRKALKARKQKKDPSRTGFSVEAIGEGEYAGFELDGDGRFLLGDFTVTHNTVMASAMIRSAYDKKKKAIFVVPSISLIDQTVERLAEDSFLDVGVMQACHEMTDCTRPVQICSAQTLMRRQIPEADLVIIDEAHRHMNFYTQWMNNPKWENIPFVGFSATPWTKGLGKHYTDLVKGWSLQDMINGGYLSPFRSFASAHPDLSGVRIERGDYREDDLSKVMNSGGLVADIVENWLKHGEGRPTLCFCVDRLHAQAVQAQFREAGVRAGYVDAFTGPDERRQLQRDFRDGEIEVVCNVGVLTTGVDWDVRCIILARPTRSEMLFCQIIGRGLRTADGKTDCIIFDHADNHLRLGFVTDIDKDQLDTGDKADKKERLSEEPLPKECPKCKCLRPPKIVICPNCGYEVKPRSKIECEDGELVDITPQEKKKNISHYQKQLWYSMMLHYAREKGYKSGYVSNKFKDKFGEWPKNMLEIPTEPDTAFKSYIRHLHIKTAYAKKKEARSS